jgi:hypothetical protein
VARTYFDNEPRTDKCFAIPVLRRQGFGFMIIGEWRRMENDVQSALRLGRVVFVYKLDESISLQVASQLCSL